MGDGPAMLRLNERQRTFVRLYLDYPTVSPTNLARMVGYTDRTNAIRVVAHRLMHSDKVLAAIQEEIGHRFRTDAAIGRAIVAQIALTDGHPQQFKAALALLDRGGFAVKSEQLVVVEKHDLTGKALLERIKALADKHGLDPARFLGSSAERNRVIEGPKKSPKA
jgi:phage terminase small subunit